jgi:recombinational DNA repair protein (RecF pathway)
MFDLAFHDEKFALKKISVEKKLIPTAPQNLRHFIFNCATVSRMAQFFARLIWLKSPKSPLFSLVLRFLYRTA